MTAARTSRISLDIAGPQKDLTAVVVDRVAVDCILGPPLLDAANPVVNWKTRKLLLSIDGPKEVDLRHNPCRSGVSDVSLFSLAQVLKIRKAGIPLYLATIRPTSEVVKASDEEEVSALWKNLVGKFETQAYPHDVPFNLR
jgi:hypothetical protein